MDEAGTCGGRRRHERYGDKIVILDAYASQARERSHVPAHRLIALVAILDDPSLLNTLLEGTRFMVVDAKFRPLIERDLALEARERMDRFIEASSAA